MNPRRGAMVLALVGCSGPESIGAPYIIDTTGTTVTTGKVAVDMGEGESGQANVIDVQSAALGPTITGRWQNALSGQIEAAGDINGDGRDDLLVMYDLVGMGGPQGPTYVIFGTDSREPITLDTREVGDGWMLIQNKVAQIKRGGDLNADGYDDLLVDVFSPERLSAALLGGPEEGNPERWVALDDAVTVRADDLGDLGCGVGDVTGDGYPDHVRPYPNWLAGTYKGVTLVHGGPMYVAGTMVGADVFVTTTIDGLAYYGCSGLGDVNGDGLGDFAVFDRGNERDAPRPGRVHVVLGAKNLPAEISAAALAAGEGGFIIDGASAYDRFGASLAPAGDVDGDGRQDILVGASRADAGAGAAYRIHGRGDTTAIDLAQPQTGVARFTAAATAERLGAAVAGGIDFNFDGVPDLAVGAPCGIMGAERCQDRVFVHHGGGLGGAIALTESLHDGTALALESPWNVMWPGANTSGFGSYLATLDFDGDGALDLAIGAPTEDWNGMDSGRVYIILAAEMAKR